MSELSNKILRLREQGYTYNQICDTLGCSKGTVSFHCGKGQKAKSAERRRQHRASHPFIKKVENFHNATCKKQKRRAQQLHKWRRLIVMKIKTFHYSREGGKKVTYNPPTFTVKDVLAKFGEHPKCHLTGLEIDIYKPRTYQFDHLVPVSRGGENTLDNLGICVTQANQAKGGMTNEEFLRLCQQVVEHHSSGERI